MIKQMNGKIFYDLCLSGANNLMNNKAELMH